MDPAAAASASMVATPASAELATEDPVRSAQPKPMPSLAAAPMDPGRDIQALTTAAQRGDAQAFSRLYDLYSFRLYKFVLVLAHGEENDAREVCQAVFIKLARRCDIFESEDRLWAWLRVLARNAFVDHCRASQRRARFLPLDAIPAEPNEPAEGDGRLTESLRDALGELTPAEQELLQAAYVDRLPLRELAEANGQTYKAVESKLGRLKQKLKTNLLRNLRHEHEL